MRERVLKYKKGGFTLIEVVVVMAIIAVLAVLVVGAIVIARRTSKESVNRANAKTMETALQAYYTKYRAWPRIYGNTCNGGYCSFYDLGDDGTAGSGTAYTSSSSPDASTWEPPKIKQSVHCETSWGNRSFEDGGDVFGPVTFADNSKGMRIEIASYDCMQVIDNIEVK